MDEKKALELQRIAFEMEEALHHAQKYVRNPLMKRMVQEAQLEYLKWEQSEDGTNTGTNTE